MDRCKPRVLIAIFFVVAFIFALTTRSLHTLFWESDHWTSSLTEWSRCNPITSGYEIVAGNQRPPSTLYFFGQHESSWESTIGADKKFKYKSFRRGLFTAETLADAEPTFLPPKGTFYSLKLKSECLQAERISSIVGLPSLPKFKNWYNEVSEFEPLSEWKKKCFNEEGVPKSEAFQFFETPNFTESDCEKIVARFWNEQQIKVVQDHLRAKGWIVKDSHCIEKLNDSSKYWIEQLSLHRELWDQSCEINQSQKARAFLWFKSLSESLQYLDENFKMSALFSGRTPASDNVVRFRIEDFAAEFDQAVQRCKKNSNLGELKDGFRSISENIRTLESQDIKGKLELLCR